MATIRNLKNAPLTEAIIDVRVELPADFVVETLEAAKARLGSRYPVVQRRERVEGHFRFQDGKPEQSLTRQVVDGFVFITEDKLTVAQFTLDGLTVSRLKPYLSWDRLIEAFRELWNVYLAVAHPVRVTRLATRYVNHVELPLPLLDLSAVLRVPPQTPPEVEAFISGFFTRLKMKSNKWMADAIVTQAVEPLGDRPVTPLLLDIDAFVGLKVAPTDPEIFAVLKRLDKFKNEIFFNTLTDEVIRRYE